MASMNRLVTPHRPLPLPPKTENDLASLQKKYCNTSRRQLSRIAKSTAFKPSQPSDDVIANNLIKLETKTPLHTTTSSSSSSSSSLISLTSPPPPIQPSIIDDKHGYMGKWAHPSFIFYSNGFPENKSMAHATLERSIPSIEAMINRRLVIYGYIAQWLKTKDYSWINGLSRLDLSHLFLITQDDVWDDYLSHRLVFATLSEFKSIDPGKKLRKFIIKMELELVRFRLLTSLSNQYDRLIQITPLPSPLKLSKVEASWSYPTSMGDIVQDVIPKNTPICRVTDWLCSDIISNIKSVNKANPGIAAILNMHPALLGTDSLKHFIRGLTTNTRERSLRYIHRRVLFLKDSQVPFMLVSTLNVTREIINANLFKDTPLVQIQYFKECIMRWARPHIIPNDSAVGIPRNIPIDVDYIRYFSMNFAPKCIQGIIENKFNLKIPHRPFRVAFVSYAERSGIPLDMMLEAVKSGLSRGWIADGSDPEGKFKEFIGSATSDYKKANGDRYMHDLSKAVSCSTFFNIPLRGATSTSTAIYACPYRIDSAQRRSSSFRWNKTTDVGTDGLFKSRCNCMDNTLRDIEDVAAKCGIPKKNIFEAEKRTKTITINGDEVLIKASYDFWNPFDRQLRIAELASEVGFNPLVSDPVGPTVHIWKKNRKK